MAQVTNEIVRQLLEQGGMYGLEKPIGDMKFVVDTAYVAAMNAPGDDGRRAARRRLCCCAVRTRSPACVPTPRLAFDARTTPAARAGGGKNDVPNRLKRQFAAFNIPLPSTAAINAIFGQLVEGRFSADLFAEPVVQVRTHGRLHACVHVPACAVAVLARMPCVTPPAGWRVLLVALPSAAAKLLHCTHPLACLPARARALIPLQVAGRLVPMTVSLWSRTQAKMLPTPAKFHYLFNMRELSKVFQGVLLAERDR